MKRGSEVVIVGGGFAGIACAKALAKHHVKVTLIDKHNYHQFQPMLYQVATAQLAPSDVAMPLRAMFRKQKSVFVKMGDVVSVDPKRKVVTCSDGCEFSGDFVVLAMGTKPNFFGTPGADEHAFPLYSLADAERLRSRVFAIFEEADRNPALIDRGALNIVIVGAGATGVETAGALAGTIKWVMPERFHQLQVSRARIYLVDPGSSVLAPFSPGAHAYAARILRERGVRLELGASVTNVGSDRVTLSDGREILTQTVVWAGGIQAEDLASNSNLTQTHGGRLEADADMTVPGFPGVYALGDVAAVPDPSGKAFVQLGSVALQQGKWAGENIVAEIEGRSPTAFRYKDKGIMAIIGRNAAVAEMGKNRREVHGLVAFAAWMGVHMWLLSGIRQRTDAFTSWVWDYFSRNRAPSVIDESDVAKLNWGDTGIENVIDVRAGKKKVDKRDVRSS